MTQEDIYDNLQKKYSEALMELYEVPNDLQRKIAWRIALNDLLVFLSNFRHRVLSY